jgi:hypothetical protein
MRHPPHPRHPRGGWQSPSGPFQRLRQKLDSIPPNYLLYTIIGLNGIVFAAWSYVQMPQVRSLLPRPLPGFPLPEQARS